MRRGNLITTTRTVNADQASITTRQSFDNLGNVVTATDARGYLVSLGYTDSFNGPAPSSSTRGFLTSINYPKAQPTDPNPPPKTLKYDYYSGRLSSVTDPNGLVTTLEYNDPLDRLTDVTRAGQRTKLTYTDTPNAMKVRKQADQYAADYRYNSETSYDSFGRPVLETSGTGTSIQVQREYDGLGRLLKVSRPRYGTSFAGAIEHTYDALGRTLTTKDIWNTSTTTQEYNGVDVTTIDPKNKKRRTELDGLGRLVKVVEDPAGLNYETTYTYSALDKLLTVTQASQTRNFTYDSLGRLMTAYNPESGTNSYHYDPNGNLASRTDARGWTVCFGLWDGSSCVSKQGTTENGYDTWNRPIRKQYSTGGSPNVDLCYDGRRYVGGTCTGTPAAPEIGRLTAQGSSASDSNFVHDSTGRTLSSWQQTAGAPQRYDFTYAYHLDSKLARTTMPVSLRNVRNCYDDQGRLYWVSGSTGISDTTCSTNPTNIPAQFYVKYESYGPGGEEWNVRYGTTASTLLQTCTDLSQSYTGLRVGIGDNGSPSNCTRLGGDLFTETWTYLWGQNNGSVDVTEGFHPASTGVNLVRTFYSYDPLNRVSNAVEYPFLASGSPLNQWQLAFNYDRYGNRIVDQPQSFAYSDIAAKSLSQYNSANQLIKSTQSVAAQDVTYDNTGNMTYHPALGTFSYNTDNQQTSAATGSGSAQYFYDGDGKRVKKVVNGVTTVFAYDAFGQLAYEYSSGSSTQSGTQYMVHDALGSTRLVLDSVGAIVSRRDYFAFGDEIPGSSFFGGRGDPALKFNQGFAANHLYTGKERDAETGLDYFGARYLSGAQGRWTSVDPISANILRVINPQRWNMYAYAVNNPLAFTDPDGRDAIAVNFGKLAGGFGHNAVVSVHRDGRATFGEFGPRGGGKPFFPGQYSVRPLQTSVKFAADGTPTSDSYAALLSELADGEGQPKDSISFVHFKTSDMETAALDAYLEAARQSQLNAKAPFYAVGVNDCRNFCLSGLRTAGINYNHAANANISANWILGILSWSADSSYSGGEKKTKVPSKNLRPDVRTNICYEGQPGCTSQ